MNAPRAQMTIATALPPPQAVASSLLEALPASKSFNDACWAAIANDAVQVVTLPALNTSKGLRVS